MEKVKFSDFQIKVDINSVCKKEISDEEYSQMKKDMFWNQETYAIEDYSTKVIK